MARCLAFTSKKLGYKEIAEMGIEVSESESSENENNVDHILDMLGYGNIHEVENSENYSSSEDDESYLCDSDNDSEIDYIADLMLGEIQVETSGESNDSYAKNESIESVPEDSVPYVQENDCSGKKVKENLNLVSVLISNKDANIGIQNTTSTNKVTTCLPGRDNWDGTHSFKIQLTYNKGSKYTDVAVYVREKNKLYVSKDLEFKICCSAVNVPESSFVRATAIYTLPEHAFEIVKRCRIHAHEDKLKGNPAYEHVLQCMEAEAVHEKNSVTGQCSVIVPYKELDRRDGANTYTYKLTCFSSCSSGLNRRPFMIQFTLENNNVILGRQTLHVRVCASPHRDSRAENRKNNVDGSNNENPEELVFEDPKQSTSRYILPVKDFKLYKFLIRMKSLYESGSYARYLLRTRDFHTT